MKGLLLLLLLPLQILAQDLPGVWIGNLHNDSTGADLHYEIVLSEQKGRLTGYSYTNFIVDGRSYTGVKSLTINQRFGKLFIEDEKLVYHNYDFEPPKGVKQASILERSGDDEIMLFGRFTTTRTKQYGKPVTGHIYLLKKHRDEQDVSKLMEILGGLNLLAGLSFVDKEDLASTTNKHPDVNTSSPVASASTDKKTSDDHTSTTAQPVKENTAPPVAVTQDRKDETVNNTNPVTKEENKPVAVTTGKETVSTQAPTTPPSETKTTAPVAQHSTVTKDQQVTTKPDTKPKEQPLASNTETKTTRETGNKQKPVSQPAPATVVRGEEKTTQPVAQQNPPKTTGQPVASNTNNTANTTEQPGNKTETKPAVPPAKDPVATNVSPVSQQNTTAQSTDMTGELASRKVVTVQTVYFTSDSLVLELYDNGYVDDDTVSIVMNGQALVTKIRLSEKASVKTIHIPPGMDSISLVMLAENLGTIAPNSGLAIIRDGKTQHTISFSGDMKKNAGIILRRKKISAE